MAPATGDAPDYASITQDEGREVIAALKQHFGPCVCQQYLTSSSGARIWVEVCAGHAFLSEQDRNVSRLARLLYVKRTSKHWRAAEWMTDQWGLAAQDLGL